MDARKQLPFSEGARPTVVGGRVGACCLLGPARLGSGGHCRLPAMCACLQRMGPAAQRPRNGRVGACCRRRPSRLPSNQRKTCSRAHRHRPSASRRHLATRKQAAQPPLSHLAEARGRQPSNQWCLSPSVPPRVSSDSLTWLIQDEWLGKWCGHGWRLPWGVCGASSIRCGQRVVCQQLLMGRGPLPYKAAQFQTRVLVSPSRSCQFGYLQVYPNSDVGCPSSCRHTQYQKDCSGFVVRCHDGFFNG
jgi:hypothetical protein